MIGAFTVGKKAVTFGYKRYGVPGAVASGGAVLAGYVLVRRALRSTTEADEHTLESAIDAQSIQQAVDEGGLEAVADREALEESVDTEAFQAGVDDLQSSVREETDEFGDDHARENE
ncbi:hypothetical protein D8Y22_13420 [Salinadaptatus halalkaliphilus]|uniref:Uncharacterized protein n=1 Tax=Salinadaptatus halalkaliphilus TaxID=2419781 RepID=A0A4S3TK74_9EURY|nr:hypothetical protein [Salinadaptatus halalkaliphilus]THE64406.1 hypothetical protein D8Y22_13420 [Salinadaptatus halalkaliphilus]